MSTQQMFYKIHANSWDPSLQKMGLNAKWEVEKARSYVQETNMLAGIKL